MELDNEQRNLADSLSTISRETLKMIVAKGSSSVLVVEPDERGRIRIGNETIGRSLSPEELEIWKREIRGLQAAGLLNEMGERTYLLTPLGSTIAKYLK